MLLYKDTTKGSEFVYQTFSGIFANCHKTLGQAALCIIIDKYVIIFFPLLLQTTGL